MVDFSFIFHRMVSVKDFRCNPKLVNAYLQLKCFTNTIRKSISLAWLVITKTFNSSHRFKKVVKKHLKKSKTRETSLLSRTSNKLSSGQSPKSWGFSKVNFKNYFLSKQTVFTYCWHQLSSRKGSFREKLIKLFLNIFFGKPCSDEK